MSGGEFPDKTALVLLFAQQNKSGDKKAG